MARATPWWSEWRADLDTGFKWPIAVGHSIAAPAERVWEAISAPGNLEACHPFCASNPVIEWPGTGSRDEIHYLNGRVYERHFEDWIEGVGYDLQIVSTGSSISFVGWRIEPIHERNSRLTISMRPGALQHLSPLVRWAPHFLWLRPRLRSYRRSVVKGFDWHVTRGEPVPRNQFGMHPWFSAPRRAVPGPGS